MSLSKKLIKLGLADPYRSAIITDKKIITYQGLLDQINKEANFLLKHKVCTRSVVGLIFNHGPEHLIAMLALARLGAKVIPINPLFSKEVKNKILEKYKANFLLTSNLVPTQWTKNSKLKVIRHNPLGEKIQCGSVNLNYPLPNKNSPYVIAIPLLLSMPKDKQLNPHAILYTQSYMLKRMEKTLDNFPDDTRLLPPDMNFTMGYITAIGTLMLGGTVIFPKTNQAEDIFNAINLYGVSHIFISAKTAEIMMELIKRSTKKIFPSLKHLRILEGQPSKSLIAKLLKKFSSNLYASYGSAETGGLTLASPEILKRSHISSGTPRAWVTLEIINSLGKKARPMESGTIRARGDLVPEAYFMEPDISAKKFKKGWFYTEDTGYLNEQGELFLSH